MDPARYLDLFLAESRERLVAAFSLQGRLESAPPEREALGEMMRHAHSLKGMAATMGYGPLVELAHAMEEVLSHLQADSRSDLTQHMPLLGDALACLGELLDAIEREGRPTSERSARLAEALRSAACVEEPLPDPGPRAAAPESPGEAVEAAAPAADGPLQAWRVDLRIDDDPARSVRTTAAVLARAARRGRLVHVDPPRVALATGRFDGRLGLVLECAHDPQDLGHDLERIAGVSAVSFARLAPLCAVAVREERASWVRVRAERLDTIADHLTELRRDLARLEPALAGGPHGSLLERASAGLRKAYGGLAEIRLVRFEIVVPRLERTVRELAPRLGKEVRLAVEGANVRIERRVLDELLDPLLHLVRNAIDHGIESADERRAVGKPAVGTVRLTLERAGERVDLRVADDGRGIDVERVRRSAVERGLLEEGEARTLDAAQVLRLVTTPGFSTMEQVTHVSGRGIGMDVAQITVEKLGGRLELTSTAGKGTAVRLIVPARRALIETLLVRSSGALFALPVERVRRVVAGNDRRGRPSDCRTERLESRRLVDCAGTRACEGTWIVLVGDERRGIAVDEILGRRDLVVLPLPPPLNLLPRYAGAALLENGSIALVPDLGVTRDGARGAA